MIQGIGSQGLGLLWAVALGAALGILYDLGRGLRRAWSGCTVPMDLLFSVLFLLSLMGLALYTGGLRIYQLLGLGLGAAAYFLTVGPLILRLWQRVQSLSSARDLIRKSLTIVSKKRYRSFREWSLLPRQYRR